MSIFPILAVGFAASLLSRIVNFTALANLLHQVEKTQEKPLFVEQTRMPQGAAQWARPLP
jgi:hypothetical protein